MLNLLNANPLKADHFVGLALKVLKKTPKDFQHTIFADYLNIGK